MREIKFRAQHIRKKIMGHPFTLRDVAEWMNNVAAKPVDTTGIVYLQSTGLMDDTKREIFEGDVVAWKEKDGASKAKTSREVISWDSKVAAFSWFHTMPAFMCDHKCEIIGNIYENPELLTR